MIDDSPAKSPFVIGGTYTRNDVYGLMSVPLHRQRGNWETGYTRWENDLFIFSTVGSAATGGYDYDNRWNGDVFVWYAKEGTKLDQPQIQWILNAAERVFVFTRPAVRHPFTFNGLGVPQSWEDSTPVVIRWQVGDGFVVLPSEVSSIATFTEGAVRQVLVNAYERNPRARRTCLNYYGYKCQVCDFDFASFYGDVGEGFIHVHHLKDLASVGQEYDVDPVLDMRPVCPNCHAMLHVEKPAMSIDRLRDIVRRQRAAVST